MKPSEIRNLTSRICDFEIIPVIRDKIDTEKLSLALVELAKYNLKTNLDFSASQSYHVVTAERKE